MIYLNFTILNDMIKFCSNQPQAKEHIEMYAGAGKEDKTYIHEVFLFALRNKLITRTSQSGITMYQAVAQWS